MTPQHLLAELLVDEGAVGEGVERHVPVLFAQADDVFFPQQRLDAGEGQALLVAIFRRPAAGAVHIAGGGGIHQNQPRHVDVVLLRRLLRRLIAPEAALVGRVGQEGLENIGAVLPDQPLGIVGPLAVGVLGDHTQGVKGGVRPGALVDLLDHVDELLGQVAHVLGLALFQHGVEDGLPVDLERSGAVKFHRDVLPGQHRHHMDMPDMLTLENGREYRQGLQR